MLKAVRGKGYLLSHHLYIYQSITYISFINNPKRCSIEEL